MIDESVVKEFHKKYNGYISLISMIQFKWQIIIITPLPNIWLAWLWAYN